MSRCMAVWPRLRFAASEASETLAANKTRAVLQAVVPMMAAAGLLATAGLGDTAATQLSASFDRRAATRLILNTDPPAWSGVTDGDSGDLPALGSAIRGLDIETQMESLQSVRSAGLLASMGDSRRTEIRRPGLEADTTVELVGVSPGYFDAAGAIFNDGRSFDAGHFLRNDRVTVLGALTAEELGISTVTGNEHIDIAGTQFLVIGILASDSEPLEYSNAAILPMGVLADVGSLSPRLQTVLDVPVGAAALAAEEAAIIIEPSCPPCTQAVLPPEPADFRLELETGLRTNLNMVFGGLAVFGALLMSAARFAEINRRRRELALRRAVGASRLDVALQLFLEGVVTSSIAGSVGSLIGNLIAVALAVHRSWTPSLDAANTAWALLITVVVGSAAGLAAVVLAVRIDPEAALRQA